ncbi:MAG: single-stranded DNA-binding protein [Chitinispirillia bacterium]|nr:single-stranded DNA-binding protein [Chitinispirillia bacterium]MCL2242730.1 single-stranded DNA-binding protein [Chitinispirillia bacterium]
MASINKVILIGNLGRDPELRYTPQGRPVVNFSMATTERWTSKEGEKQEKTEWHNIVLWGRQAEIANQYLKKGSSCYIEGRISTRSWEDKDKVKRYRTEIEGQILQFLGGGGGGGGGYRSDAPSQPDDYYDSFPDNMGGSFSGGSSSGGSGGFSGGSGGGGFSGGGSSGGGSSPATAGDDDLPF